MSCQKWIGVVLAFAASLNACALNNEMVIGNNDSSKTLYFINNFEFRFPPKINIHLEPLQDASWRISGNISDIVRDVVSEISAINFKGLANQHNS